MTGQATILRGNALDLPLADATVDLIVTSPPYFGLRSYQDGGERYDGQIGSEATPVEFVDALLAATAEMVRVLKPSGSLWVNLGDKYAAGHGGSSTEGNGVNINVGHRAEANFRERPDLPNPPASWGKRDATGRAIVPGFRPKTLMGMPWRYAIACIDQLGLILRAEVIWAKPNGLPESVTDRVRRSHETWFHFVKQPRYFSAVDEIREEHQPQSIARTQRNRFAPDLSQTGVGSPNTLAPAEACNPLGKLPGSVWTVPTQPLTVPAHLGVDHFAAFPMEWPRRIIRGWSPSGVCVACGEGRRPVIRGSELSPEGEALAARRNGTKAGDRAATVQTGKPAETLARHMQLSGPELQRHTIPATITGYACACTPTRVRKIPSTRVNRDPRGYDEVTEYAWDEWTPAPTTPAVVLDPFGGTGTVALVAKALGRHGISLDMSADYCRLATWRTTDEGELARALQVEKPAKQVDGQLSLLEALA